ncbi:hypothetical protein BJX61DRAFT_508181 [Aspergillus egyptiacus]|nr:hypothetical protein BJX61DRAFT_508181 [Aspergillus egyptiacus]
MSLIAVNWSLLAGIAVTLMALHTTSNQLEFEVSRPSRSSSAGIFTWALDFEAMVMNRTATGGLQGHSRPELPF